MMRKGVRVVFGYVRVFQPELKVREWEDYRGAYCSLCRALGKRYGVFARFLLNYDFTVLALFHMALEKTPVTFSKGRCPFNPLKKCRRCHGDTALNFAADAAVLLSYYKLKDDVVDGHWGKRLMRRPLLWLLTPMKRRATKLSPTIAAEMARYYEAQRAVEGTKSPSPDAAAHPTATLMAALTVRETPSGEVRDARARFGYCLGRWIYFMDATDDWEEDYRHGGFNPFPADEHGARPTARMREALNSSLAECLTAWHLLDRYQFDAILQNILQYGMPATTARVTATENPKRKGRKTT